MSGSLTMQQSQDEQMFFRERNASLERQRGPGSGWQSESEVTDLQRRVGSLEQHCNHQMRRLLTRRVRCLSRMFLPLLRRSDAPIRDQNDPVEDSARGDRV
jgi:hypothetical protein